jgi:hypothetical protein
MAKRREVVRRASGGMPAGLEPVSFRSFPEDGTEAERAEWRAGKRARRADRAKFLAGVLVRPDGVQVSEFLQAHGYLFTDRGTSKVAHLIV